MPYTLYSSLNAPNVVHNTLLAPAGTELAVLGFYATDPSSATAGDFMHLYRSTGGATPTAQVPEKTNTNSAASAATANRGSSTDAAIVGRDIVALGFSTVVTTLALLPRLWRVPNPRYPVVVPVSGQVSLQVDASGNAVDRSLLWGEPVVRYADRARGRRGRTRGEWQHMDAAGGCNGLVTRPATRQLAGEFRFFQPQDWEAVAQQAPVWLEAVGDGSPQTVSPGGVDTAEAFGVPQLDFTLFPTGIATAEAFGTAQLDITLFPVALASGETFGVAVVSAQNLISPGGIASAEAFGAAVLSATSLISPSAIATGEAFGAATIIYDVVVSPGGLASAEGFGTAQLNLTIFPAGVTTAEVFGAAALIANYTMSPVGVVSGEAFGTALITTANTVLPSGIPTGETFGLADVLAANTVSPTGIASAEAVGAHTVSPGTAIILPPGVASAEAFGIPDVSGGVQALVQALKSLLAIGIRL